MRIALVNAPLQSAIADLALGHQTPLGLLMLAGPLLEDGFEVDLFDAGREHWSDEQTVDRLNAYRPNIVMIGHSASTKAHPGCLRLLRAVKHALPGVVTVYGGVHPTFQSEEILAEHPEVDVIVRGEGELTALALVRELCREPVGEFARIPPSSPVAARPCELGLDLSSVDGITWRDGQRVIVNGPRSPRKDLEGCRIAWELIRDWDKYQAFGQGRTAVVQFSRGCPHRCTYCGQWHFWQRWRHRDVSGFVDELEYLYREHDVRFLWFADENPTTRREVWKSFLEEIVRRDMHVGMTASIRARDIVRDADILDLYRQAGFLYVLMGVETVSDQTMRKVGKESSVDDARQAVRLLRQHRMLSIIDYIFGFEQESLRTIWRAYRGLNLYDSNFVNVLHLIPYPWTAAAGELRNRTIIEKDLWKWDYRHQVISNDGLSPSQLFLGIRMIEVFYHLHPKRLMRMIFGGDGRLRRQIRYAYGHVAGVFVQEMFEHLRGKLFRR